MIKETKALQKHFSKKLISVQTYTQSINKPMKPQTKEERNITNNSKNKKLQITNDICITMTKIPSIYIYKQLQYTNPSQ